MKKINFTIVLFATGFIATAVFAAFNYYIINMGDSNSGSMANGINNSGEVFDIEDEKNNFGIPNAERVISISSNDSGQTGGASDTAVILAVAGADGEITDATQPFVWDNGLIAALETSPGYRSVEIPFGINSAGRAVGYSGASGVTSSSGASGGASSSGVSGGTSSSAVSGVTSSAVESETASSSSNESESTSSSGLSPDSAGELISDSGANETNGAEQAAGSSGESESTSFPELSDNSLSFPESSGNAFSPEAATNDSINDIVDLNEFPPSDDFDWGPVLAIADEIDAEEVIGYNYDEVTLHPNPEPATIFLFGSGLISLGVFGRKKLKCF